MKWVRLDWMIVLNSILKNREVEWEPKFFWHRYGPTASSDECSTETPGYINYEKNG
jgi:hypothetical protein